MVRIGSPETFDPGREANLQAFADRTTRTRAKDKDAKAYERATRGPRTPYGIQMEALRTAQQLNWSEIEAIAVHVADLECKITDQRSLQNGGGMLALYTNTHYVHAVVDAFHAGIGQLTFARLYTIPFEAWAELQAEVKSHGENTET